jgi:hypothetical protein
MPLVINLLQRTESVTLLIIMLYDFSWSRTVINKCVAWTQTCCLLPTLICGAPAV